MCVCVCVCVRERERERERVCVYVCVCVCVRARADVRFFGVLERLGFCFQVAVVGCARAAPDSGATVAPCRAQLCACLRLRKSAQHTLVQVQMELRVPRRQPRWLNMDMCVEIARYGGRLQVTLRVLMSDKHR